jgi:hypothetical protein
MGNMIPLLLHLSLDVLQDVYLSMFGYTRVIYP